MESFRKGVFFALIHSFNSQIIWLESAWLLALIRVLLVKLRFFINKHEFTDKFKNHKRTWMNKKLVSVEITNFWISWLITVDS